MAITVECCVLTNLLQKGANMKRYVILRMNKLKIDSVAKIGNHHERLKKIYKSNPDIDLKRTHLNYHLKQPEGKYRQLVMNRIEESGAKRRKNSVVLQDALVTASPEWMDEQSYETQVAYFNHAYKYFVKKFGEENIISAVVHMDEAHPHMHLCFVPITKDNRLSSKDLIGGPSGLRKHQDDFYAHMVEAFPEMMRGLPKEVTHRKHIPTEFFKNAAHLMEHYEEITSAINDIGLVNSPKKKERAIALIGQYAPEMANMASQLKMVDNHVANLEEALSDANNSKWKYRDTAFDQEKEIIELKEQLTELSQKQKQLVKIVKLIPPELLDQLKKEENAKRKTEREVR